MSRILPALFLLGYFLGGYAVIFYLVVVQKIADQKFIEAVELYYPFWIGVYSPMAVLGTIISLRTGKTLRQRNLLTTAFLFSILTAIFISYLFDANWVALLAQYVLFSVLFYLALHYFPKPRGKKPYQIAYGEY